MRTKMKCLFVAEICAGSKPVEDAETIWKI